MSVFQTGRETLRDEMGTKSARYALIGAPARVAQGGHTPCYSSGETQSPEGRVRRKTNQNEARRRQGANR